MKHSTIYSRLFRLFLWILILFLLWWALKDIPLREITGALKNLTLAQILTIAGVNTLLMLFLSARWWLILHAQGYTLPYLTVSAYRLAAFSVAYFTPGPHFGGEPWQVFLPQQRHGVPGRVALAALGLDKLLDLSANFTFLVVGVLIILSGGLIEGDIGVVIILVSLCLLAAPVAYLVSLWRSVSPKNKGEAPLTRVLIWIAARRPLPSWGEKVGQVVKESEALAGSFGKQYPGPFLLSILISGFVWVGLITEFWLALHFLGESLSLPQIFSVITAARIANLFPTPGGLGTLEAGQVLVMEALGIHPAIGLSLSLIIRARDLAFGGVGLWFAGVYSPKVKLGKLEGEHKI